MKNHQLKIAVLSLSALAFVSCKKDDKSAATGDMMSFTATIDNGGAKTVIDGVNVKWTTDDQININGKTFTAQVEGDGTTAVFTSESGETVEGTPYKALYPADLYKGENSYELPNEQTYNEANSLSGINPMYAESSTTELQFHHICGLLKLDVKGDGTVKKIVVEADKPLSGEFTINEDGCYAEVDNSGAKTVTLDCGDGVAIHSNTATTFYIALPQGKYDGLNVKLTGGKDWDTTFSVNINAGKIRTKELIGVDVVKPVPPDCVSGEFSVSATDKVYFSKGNLQAKYNGTNYDWGFAENQWDYIGGVAGNTTINDDGTNETNAVVDLFCWSTDAASNNWGIHIKGDDTDGFTTGNFKDWGKNISDGNTWRTLSKDEWVYLINTRKVKDATGYNNTCVWATVNGVVNGLIIFPDDYEGATTSLTSIPEGCVFLPVTGNRAGTSVDIDDDGRYWSSSPNTSFAYRLFFYSSSVVTPADQYGLRYHGNSVRLVQDVK